MSISAVIITKNEEINIRRCLESIKWVDEIIVVDSQSTDKTVEIAREYNAVIISPEWQGYGKAKNIGVDKAVSDWVFSIDADEEVSEELQKEIRQVMTQANLFDGLFVRRKTLFMGRWIKHCGWYPDYVLRLFKKKNGRFDDAVIHEKVIMNGRTKYSEHDLNHYSYTNLEQYFDKFNRYTEISANEFYGKRIKGGWFCIIVKPFVSFIKHYIIKQGFRDGIEGFILSVLSSVAVFVKYAKVIELNKKKNNG